MAYSLHGKDSAQANWRDFQKVHELKTWPAPFEAVRDGSKSYELRVADRDFQVGDLLRLREFDPLVDPQCSPEHGYTLRELTRRISYITPPGTFGLPDNLCILALEAAPEPPQPEWWYTHQKSGKQVQVLGVARGADDDADVRVCYREFEAKETHWHRPLRNFQGWVWGDGQPAPRPRFRKGVV